MGRWRRAQSAQRQCLISHSSSGRFGKLSKERRSAYREVVQLTRGELAGFARRRATRNETGHALRHATLWPPSLRLTSHICHNVEIKIKIK